MLWCACNYCWASLQHVFHTTSHSQLKLDIFISPQSNSLKMLLPVLMQLTDYARAWGKIRRGKSTERNIYIRGLLSSFLFEQDWRKASYNNPRLKSAGMSEQSETGLAGVWQKKKNILQEHRTEGKLAEWMEWEAAHAHTSAALHAAVQCSLVISSFSRATVNGQLSSESPHLEKPTCRPQSWTNNSCDD